MAGDLAQFQQRRLSNAQRAMLALLGNPEIIGGAGTAVYFIDDPVEADMPFLKPPYSVSYYCPVVVTLDLPRRVMPNGDLIEVEQAEIGPADPDW